MGPIAQIFAAFGIVKSIQLVILHLLPTQFDVSSSILLENYCFEKDILCSINTPYSTLNGHLNVLLRLLLDTVVDRLVIWDAVYFSDLFAHGPKFEHQYVFCPLWWRLINLVPAVNGAVFYPRLIVATLVANLAHLGAALVLYSYTLSVFKNARIFNHKKMALCLLVLFVMTPAAAFMTAPYSEPVAALLSLLCMYFRQLGLGASPIVTRKQKQEPAKDSSSSDGWNDEFSLNSRKAAPKSVSLIQAPSSFRLGLYLLSGLFAAISYGFRANCLLLGIFYLYDLATLRPFPAYSPVFAGLLLGLAFVFTQYHNYVSICVGSDRGEWCDSKLPLLFTYAQAHYWNNGFFNYWTPNNIPNFVFGAPTIFLSFISVRYFRSIYPVDRVYPVLIVNSVFIVLLLVMWHVQIVTRIHLFMPIIYWLVGGLLTQPNERHRKWGHYCVGYFVIWNVLQTSLFGAFLPPA